MDQNTLLVISYGELKELLDAMQTDGLNADGCCYSLGATPEEEIEYGLKDGTIKTIYD